MDTKQDDVAMTMGFRFVLATVVSVEQARQVVDILIANGADAKDLISAYVFLGNVEARNQQMADAEDREQLEEAPKRLANDSTSNWLPALEVFKSFCANHPELGKVADFWALHNMLRRHRQSLEAADALRRVSGRHWIAHRELFPKTLFDLLTLSRRAETNKKRNDTPLNEEC